MYYLCSISGHLELELTLEICCMSRWSRIRCVSLKGCGDHRCLENPPPHRPLPPPSWDVSFLCVLNKCQRSTWQSLAAVNIVICQIHMFVFFTNWNQLCEQSKAKQIKNNIYWQSVCMLSNRPDNLWLLLSIKSIG